MNSYQFIEFNKKDSFIEVVLNRPEVHNAFNAKLIEELTNAFVEIEKLKDIRLVVLKSNGKSFCAGADLNWMKSMKDFNLDQNLEDSGKLAKMFQTIDQCSYPVIGCVQGLALGGGVGLLSVCDYVISSVNSRFGFTETKLGLIPAVIMPYCLKKIGYSMVNAYAISGELFNVDVAHQMHLVHEIVQEEEIEKKLNTVIERFKTAAPQASIICKKYIKKMQEHINSNSPEIISYSCSVIAERRNSSEAQEGMSALLEKRKPSWKSE